MATITSNATGNWSTGATWAGGVAPTAADDAVIAKNHVITVNDATCVALTVTLNVGTTGVDVGGKLTPSLVANSTLTVERGITCSGTSGGSGSYSSYFAFDMSTAPTITCNIILNNSNATGAGYGLTLSGNFNLVGAVKKRWSTINSALVANTTLSVVVADATGWVVGDMLIFATTSTYSATPLTDTVTIATITPGAGTTATVTWTDGTGTGGAVANAHASACPVGNFTSNLIVKPGTAGNVAWVFPSASTANTSIDAYITDVLFTGQAAGSTFAMAGCSLNTSGTHVKSCSNNAFYDYRSVAIFLRGMSATITRQFNIFYTTAASTACMSGLDVNGNVSPGPDTDYAIFRSALGLYVSQPDQYQYRHEISGITVAASLQNGAIINTTKPNISINDCNIWSSNSGVINSAYATASGCAFGSSVFAGCNNTSNILEYAGKLVLTDCLIPSTLGLTGMTSGLPNSLVRFENKNADASIQEVYGSHSNTVPIIQRDTETVAPNHSSSSVKMTCNGTTAITESFQVLAKAATALKIKGWFYRNATYGASTLPFVTLSGLGITPVIVTQTAAVSTWEEWTLDLASGDAPASDGLLTVTFTAQSATANAYALFSGCPDAPFVSRARHYGYIFDETNAVVNANITTSVSEATAIAYANIAVTGGATTSSTSITVTNRTFQQFYDYGQAWACSSAANIGYVPPVTGAGVAGSPALFAKGDITIGTGITLSGSGSLSMGSYLLTTEFAGAVAYSYTGGTWSQATTVPTFSGGTVNIGASGTYTFTMAASTILSITPTAPSTYVLGGSTFTGTADLRNAAAPAITVELPSGTTYTTANNTGGVITVTIPALYQSVTISGLVANSRVQIYDTTSSTELSNAVVAGTSTTWTDSVAAASNRAIRVRISLQTTVTAKAFIEANIGTCGTTSGTKDISYLASQVADTTYNTNAIDGSTVTGITIAPSPARVAINLAGGSTTWPSIYAYQVYWLYTAAGIADEAAFISAPDTANYLLTNFSLKNTNAAPLTITGGYGRDSATGLVATIIDSTTSTGNIYPQPDHAIPYSSGSGLTAGQAAQLTSIEGYTDTLEASMTRVSAAITNKHVLNPADGTVKVYDDAGALLYTGLAYSDAAGTVLYNGTSAVHHTTRLT